MRGRKGLVATARSRAWRCRAPAARPGAVRSTGEDEDGRTGGGPHIRPARDLRREAFDRGRLREVERLARRDIARVVDEHDRSRDVATCDDMRYRAAQLARADDRD